MLRYDLAIHGFGMLPGLLAVHLLDRDPGQQLLLLSGDATVGGEALEPVTEASLSPAARALVDPFAVSQWSGYFVTRGGKTEQHADNVLLLDPVQLWLELRGLLPDWAMPARCEGVVHAGTELRWSGEQAEVASFADLVSLTRREEHREILGLDQVRALPLPVLADLDTGDEPWDAFQHVPLGDERVFVRKLRCNGDVAAQLTSGFGRLLSELIA